MALAGVSAATLVMSWVAIGSGHLGYGLAHLALTVTAGWLAVDLVLFASLLNARRHPLCSVVGLGLAGTVLGSLQSPMGATTFSSGGWTTLGAMAVAGALLLLAVGERQRNALAVLAGRIALIVGGLTTGTANLIVGLGHPGHDPVYGACLVTMGAALVALSTMELRMVTLGLRLVFRSPTS
jgi:hypothetical protein